MISDLSFCSMRESCLAREPCLMREPYLMRESCLMRESRLMSSKCAGRFVSDLIALSPMRPSVRLFPASTFRWLHQLVQLGHAIWKIKHAWKINLPVFFLAVCKPSSPPSRNKQPPQEQRWSEKLRCIINGRERKSESPKNEKVNCSAGLETACTMMNSCW